MSQSVNNLYDGIMKEITSKPLSKLLPLMLILAQKLYNQALENWVRLEMNGYFQDNPAMNPDIEIPEYRTIVGRLSDDYGRILDTSDPKVHFLNNIRIPMGIAELERLANDTEMLVIQNPPGAQTIREQLGVYVTRFTFHPSTVDGVISNIRSKSIDWLNEIEPDIKNLVSNQKVRDSEQKIEHPWHYTLITISILMFIGSIFWFYLERNFEPLIGIFTSLAGLIIAKANSSKTLDLILSLILIFLFIMGVFVIFWDK
jgi:hypothetical protein